ncbi:hypothetical protein CPB86DRAFT_528799 [Serendipita vermifera]|nr:hypothetical protein CPB86DRAFT_528799 [Serendipita vermifera]
MSQQAVCVYCASSMGTHPAYENSAKSLGAALARSSRPLIYGGGKMGLMGTVSQAVLDNGGHVTGISPFAMVAAGGEGSKTLEGANIDSSMHDRKLEMAKKADGGFVALPGGFGTLEEVLEVTTWSQLAIHIKPVFLVNVLGYYGPLREQITLGVKAGFIKEESVQLITFIDGPADMDEHTTFDWGEAVVKALDEWKPTGWKGFGFDWGKQMNGRASPLQSI